MVISRNIFRLIKRHNTTLQNNTNNTQPPDFTWFKYYISFMLGFWSAKALYLRKDY